MIIRIDAIEYYKERSEDEKVKFNNAMKWLDTLAGRHIPRFYSIDEEHIKNVKDILDIMGYKYTVMPDWYLSDAPYENLLRMVKRNPCIVHLDVMDELPHGLFNGIAHASVSSDQPCSSLDFEDAMDVIEFVVACIERHYDNADGTINSTRRKLLKGMEARK